jgi:hypothetical protein
MAGSPWVSTTRAEETPKVSPTKARPWDAYYPNSEDLAPDEMRVIGCGMPTTPAAACFPVEPGNGNKSLMPEKTAFLQPLGEYGFIVIVKDTEGNMIGLHSMR